MLAALLEYVAAHSVRRGRVLSPPAAVWREAMRRRADVMGWVGDYPVAAVGMALVAAGFRRERQARVGYLVDAHTAAALWALAGQPRRQRPRKRRAKLSPTLAMRMAARTFRPTRPVRTCDGKTWPSVGQLARALRCSRAAVYRAIERSDTVLGLHVSYLDAHWTAKSAKSTVAAHEDDFGIPSPS